MLIVVLFFAILGYSVIIETHPANSSFNYSIVENSSPSTENNSIAVRSSTIISESIDYTNSSTVPRSNLPTTVTSLKGNKPDSHERYMNEIRNNWMKKKWRREWSRNQTRLAEKRRQKEKEKEKQTIST